MASLQARMESAQHILHHILTHEYQAQQTGMQISENHIRLDVRCLRDLTQLDPLEFESQVNAVIAQNLQVTKTLYKRPEVPGDIDISMIPEKVKEVRIVAIGDFDIQPCGNAHVDTTREIGAYRLLEIKRKGKDIYRFSGMVVDQTTPSPSLSTQDASAPGKFELQLAKGTRDFPPEEKILRDEIIRTITQAFERYGFNPLETPVLERYDVLAAKFAAGEQSDAMSET
ncbi:hypothetical protein COY95_03380, partial [Candidatus Woesearchaeota archaeon CG_4_10_14_0_8_um_filter_47_5]